MRIEQALKNPQRGNDYGRLGVTKISVATLINFQTTTDSSTTREGVKN